VAKPITYLWGKLAAAGLLALLPGAALADQPRPWEIWHQEAASPIMERIESFNAGLTFAMALIVIFVLALLVYVMLRFNARANPTPSRTSHNTLIEVIWTVGPILILIGIAVPSFSLLFAQEDPARIIEGFDPSKDRVVTLKATGYQWYWGYEYPTTQEGAEPVSFESRMLADADRTDPATQPRLLAVDNEVVLPLGVVVDLQVTGADVIHSFALPAFGVKIDALPGRLNSAWFRADREGVFYGQCSELCGRDHAFMPIAIRIVKPEQYDAWLAAAQTDLEGAYRLLADMTKDDRKDVDVAAR